MAIRDTANPSSAPPINKILVILLIVQGVWCQRVKVVPEVEAYPTESVDLRCQFAEGGASTTKLTQVSWIWEPEEDQPGQPERDNIAVFHPTYGESFPESPFKGRVVFLSGSLDAPSIRISKLRMKDAGRYTCEYATYPSGNEQGTTTLVMLAKPRNSASVVTVPVGKQAVVVAKCEAADGKPAAEIKWLTRVTDGNHNTTSKEGVDGTVTVSSVYRAVPVASDNGKEITCIISQRTQAKPESFLMKLSVEYPPTVTIEGYDDNWWIGRTDVTLTCQAEANPPPTTVTWTSMSGPLPDTVEIKGNQLTVRRVDDAVNTTFVCEVRNRLGVNKHQITAIVIDKQKQRKGSSTGAIIGVIIALLIVGAIAGAVIVFLRKRKRDADNGDGPPKHKPPPPVKTGSSTEMLNKSSEPPVNTEMEPLSHMYYETSGEPVTDLDADDVIPPGGAANGGALTGPEDSLRYDEEVDEPSHESLPPYSAPAPPPRDGHHDDREVTPPELPSVAAVARGESFVSTPMYV